MYTALSGETWKQKENRVSKSEENQVDHTQAAKVIKENSYMDDICD